MRLQQNNMHSYSVINSNISKADETMNKKGAGLAEGEMKREKEREEREKDLIFGR